MTTHSLFQGGLPVYHGFTRRQFPSRRMEPYADWAVDYRKMNSHFSNSRLIDLSCNQGCQDCGEQNGSIELRNYFDEHTFAVGDRIEIIGITKFSRLECVWWNVEGAVPGLTFDLSIEGLAGSSVPAAVALGALDAGVVASGTVEMAPPIYFDHNDMLVLTVTALPAPPATAGCSGCVNSPLSGLKLWLSTVGNELCRGDVQS